MTVRCVALFSGGLDSMLAVRIMQEQGIEVEVLNFKTLFTCCQDQAGRAARELGVRLTVLATDDDYLDLVKYPRFGYGKGANPCVDCRIYMFQRARDYMERSGAKFMISGEVVGQRPMSQKKRDLEVIAFHSQLEDLLLRPLSAKLLPPTLPEREGWVDRGRLYAFRGRGRRELIALAEQFGLRDIPTPSTGCALTEQLFAKKVHDLIQFAPQAQRWEFELLKVGRHFRWNETTKVVVGRNEAENDQLEYLYRLPDAANAVMLRPENFMGPRVLVVGEPTAESLAFASGLILRYSKHYDPDQPLIFRESAAGSEVFLASPDPRSLAATSLASESASA
jgi:tRNA U34 2-thiouridine synthase MnmA/TrmU